MMILMTMMTMMTANCSVVVWCKAAFSLLLVHVAHALLALAMADPVKGLKGVYWALVLCVLGGHDGCSLARVNL